MKKIVWFCVHVTLALIFGEIIARIAFPEPPKPVEKPKVFVHEKSDNIKLLYKPSPGAENTAYGVYNKINNSGFRDREFPIEKTPGTKRVVFTGDSVVYGYGLSLEDTLPKQLEKRFEEVGQKVEILNFGVSGYESEQQVEFLKELGLRYKPDFVIAGYTMNDSNYGSWELDLFHSLLNDQVLEHGNNPFKNFLTFLYTKSRFVALLDERLKIQKKVKTLRSYRTPIRRFIEDRNRKNRDPLDSPYRRLEPQILADAKRLGTHEKVLNFMMGTIGFGNVYDLYQSHWYVSRKAFEELKKLSDERGFKVIVVIFPIMQEMDKYPLDSIHHFLNSEFKKIGFEVIDLLDYGKKIYKEHGFEEISMDSMHLNANGSRLVSKYLYEQLKNRFN